MARGIYEYPGRRVRAAFTFHGFRVGVVPGLVGARQMLVDTSPCSAIASPGGYTTEATGVGGVCTTSRYAHPRAPDPSVALGLPVQFELMRRRPANMHGRGAQVTLHL